jgi:hypothetical protein
VLAFKSRAFIPGSFGTLRSAIYWLTIRSFATIRLGSSHDVRKLRSLLRALYCERLSLTLL